MIGNISRIRPANIPLMKFRDIFHSKIKESSMMKMKLLVYHDMLKYNDPKRSYKILLDLMDKYIQKQRE